MEAYVDLSEEGMAASLWIPVPKETSSVLLHAPIEYQLEKKVSELAPVKHSAKALLEKLRLKYLPKTWNETYKLVRYCMDRPAAASIKGVTEHPILRCINILQEAVKAKSLSTLLTKIESISKQKGLESHLGPTGRICYITSEMFYIEIKVKKNGHVEFVKLAHHGESPTICKELLLLLRNKDFEGFGKSLEGLLSLYSIPGDSDVKTKVYHALCSLEEDMTALFNLSRPTNDKDRISTILHGKVGFLSPRSGGTPMNIEYYISPYQDLEEKLESGTPVVGSNVSVTVAGTTNWYHLPMTPLFQQTPQEGSSIHWFSSDTEESSMVLPACFFLRFDNPEPVLLSLIQKIQNITGLPVVSTKESPLHQLIMELKHKCLEDLNKQEFQFVLSLSGCKSHCYVMNSQSESAMIGALVNKIPFTHPSHVPSILEILRHQAAYNTLLHSCIPSTIDPKEAETSMLHFEVSLQRDFGICITFQHPHGDSLSCVVVDVLSCRKLTCSLYTSPSDPPSPYNNEFIMKELQSCMSIPLTMRTIFQKTEEVNISQDLEIDCITGNNDLIPFSSEDHKETVIEQCSVPQDTQSISENKPSDVSGHSEDLLSEEGNGVYPVELHESSSSPSQEPSSSHTEDSYFHPTQVNSSATDDLNSSVPEESYSSPVEEPSTSIVQEFSPNMVNVSSPIISEDPSSSVTEEISSSVIEELSSSIIEEFNVSVSESTTESEIN